MPAEAQHSLPGDGFPDEPVYPVPEHPVPEHPASLATAPSTGTQDLDEIVDWESEAPLREDDPYRSYCEEGEPRDGEEWLEESYLLAAPGGPGPEQFAVGGAADSMAPGPHLAALADQVWQQDLSGLDDDQLTGVLQAANRLAAWSAALRVAAVSGLAARRETAGQESGDWRPFDHIDDEIAVALTLTRRSGGRLVELALGLDRLPLTRAALAAGLIDERRAEVITDELAGLDDEHAAAVEKLIIGKAPGLTTGQLRALVRRAVLAADPAAARQRKEQALKDARVESFTEHAGTAGLSGRDLCPVDVLAADKHLTALAQAMKAAGISGTMDTLRAHAYLHLLTGQPADTLLDPAPGASTPPESPGNPPGGSTPLGTSLGLRGTVNLTMPLSAWLGWTQSPGDVPGFGPLDAADSRTLADLLGRGTKSQWCVTLTDRAGHPVAHACARHGPPGPPRRPATPHEQPNPGASAPPDLTPSGLTAPSLTGPSPTGPSPPRGGPGPAVPVPDWLRGLAFTALQTTDCTHPRQSPGYQASPALRHLIQIRNPACTGPGCRRPATRCDLDHVIPYDQGGKTCECNLHPACRHDHQAKQAPGWTVTCNQPGTLTWTTPGNRTHTSTPAQY